MRRVSLGIPLCKSEVGRSIRQASVVNRAGDLITIVVQPCQLDYQSEDVFHYGVERLPERTDRAAVGCSVVELY